MFIILFASIIGLVMLGVKIKDYRDNKSNLQTALGGKKVEHYSFYTTFIILYSLFVIIGFASAIFGLFVKDDTTTAMGIVIALLFLGELINAPLKYSLYYNDSMFIAKGKPIRYKSIQSFEKIKNIPFAYIKVVTTNGEKYPVSPKSYQIILKNYEQIRKK
ncbi:hypothetical protein [Anaerorhabdus sp.]|uniref:hypothetical protein n=1 Tax=Anaerorhabdus sp. TaxID=1872524 RepID=UPI002FC712D4